MGTRFFRFVTILAFDRQTDRRTERPWQYRALQYMQLHGKKLVITALIAVIPGLRAGTCAVLRGSLFDCVQVRLSFV